MKHIDKLIRKTQIIPVREYFIRSNHKYSRTGAIYTFYIEIIPVREYNGLNVGLCYERQ